MVDNVGYAEGASFATVVKQARIKAALTQRELAARTGMSLAALRDLEQGRSLVPRAAARRALIATLGLTSSQLEPLYQATEGDEASRGAGSPSASETHARQELRVGILGPLAILDRPSSPGLGTGRHKVLLARLALAPNTTVSRDQLIDLLWCEDPPHSAVNLIHTYIGRLRRILEPHRATRAESDVLTYSGGGYRLNLGPGQLDASYFRELTQSADTSSRDPEHAMALLENALELWRGDPLCDVEELCNDPMIAALNDDRISAVILYAQMAEELSRQEVALPRLRDLAVRHPLHEPLQGRFIAALAMTGRQAAALDWYHSVRRKLGDELGIDPGPELGQVYHDVLHQRLPRARHPTAAPAHPVPYQAPAPPADFTGRANELRELQRILHPEANKLRHSPRVCVITGAAGVGKTAVALSVAQLLRSAAFPDGQLFVDLQGAGPHRVPAVQALARLLRSLGLQGNAIPTDEQESAALYRTTIADRRMLIILDNAYDAAQIRPLVPGTAGCAVLITSRRRLVALEGATLIDLGIFTSEESLSLLRAMAGSARVAAEIDAARQLGQVCGQLPLALRVAGGRLASRPTWSIGSLVERLSDQRRRLNELQVEDLDVEASFELSYRDLPPQLARVFRLVSLIPGNNISVAAAAAMLGEPSESAARDLNLLGDANLVESLDASRFDLHDLLRAFAQRRATAQEPPAARAAALSRLFDWYLATTADAMRLVYPGMVRLPLDIAVESPTFTSADAAFDWLDRELHALEAAIHLAAEQGQHRRAWELADQLRGYFLMRRNTLSWLATGEAGLAAAKREGDRRAQAAMHQTLGQAAWSAGRHEAALAHYRTARALAEQVDWHLAVAYLYRGMGQVESDLGHLDQAEESLLEGMRISKAFGHEYVQAVILNDLGALCHDQGALDRALAYFRQSLEINTRLSHDQSAASNRHNIAMILRQQGEFETARRLLADEIARYRDRGSPLHLLSSLDEMSQLHTQVGEHDEAISTAEEALLLTHKAKDPRAESAVLGTLGDALLAAGHKELARIRFQNAETLASEHSYPFYSLRAQAGLARVDLTTGMLESARYRATSVVTGAQKHGFRTLEVEGLLVQAQAHMDDGSCEQAADICRNVLRMQAGETTWQGRLAERMLARANLTRQVAHLD